MKKTLLFALLSLVMMGFFACNNNQYSKPYKEAKEILDNITNLTNKAKDCDDLDVAAFGILGMLGVDGVDSLPQEEQQLLSEQMDKLSELMEQRRTELNCVDETDGIEFDDDFPADAPYDEEVE